MKFTAIFATVFSFTVVVAALEAGPAPALEERDLKARACVASKCICNKVQGQFCGNESINRDCTNGHVFECNGSTGA
ncbi:hypothetical protein Moror_5011, partial [Moniliophthora roreri MCA 2997]